MTERSHLRNFCIIAHIDHGKSTLADRFLELTETVDRRNMQDQMLDAMELERERGITIKLTPVRMRYRESVLNLIDTPGHVDFSYEVSRSLAAVEGAILLVDATQGIQAQTLSHLELARSAGITIIPAVNKIDVPTADVESVVHDLARLLGTPASEVLRVSAKNGEGIQELMDTIVARVPPPPPGMHPNFRALVFDSVFDPYKGVIVFVRVTDGRVRKNDLLTFTASGAEVTAIDIGVFQPELTPCDDLSVGEIGYIATGLHETARARVGDTVIHRQARETLGPLPGYTLPQPTVYAGVYPMLGEGFPALRQGIGKLRLSDAALTAEIESSPALGQGYRCGFLGLLHVEIVRERLRREQGVEVTVTVPSVAYRVSLHNGTARVVRSASEFPDPSTISLVTEPYARVTVLARRADIGRVLKILSDRRGSSPATETLSGERVELTADVPLRELVANFHDELKAVTSGYGSFSFRVIDERPVDLVKLSVLVNHEPVEALSLLLPAEKAPSDGRRIVERLKNIIPRQLFAIPLQAALGGKVIARETIPALRKDVTGYLYGGDVTRKRKLLEKQKRGKKKLAARGDVEIPPEAYLAVLKP